MHWEEDGIAGHKQDCGTQEYDGIPLIVPEQQEQQLPSHITKDGFGLFSNEFIGSVWGTNVLKQDPSGGLFDVITDRDVYFLP
jgi:hypothetical protein